MYESTTLLFQVLLGKPIHGHGHIQLIMGSNSFSCFATATYVEPWKQYVKLTQETEKLLGMIFWVSKKGQTSFFSPNIFVQPVQWSRESYFLKITSTCRIYLFSWLLENKWETSWKMHGQLLKKPTCNQVQNMNEGHMLIDHPETAFMAVWLVHSLEPLDLGKTTA